MPDERVSVEAIMHARKAAEAVVKDMSEGPLKTKAFEVAMKHVLERGGEIVADAAKATGRVPRKRQGGASSGRRRRVDARKGVLSWLRVLVGEGFFAEDRSLGDIVEHLRLAKAVTLEQPQISGKIIALVRDGTLARGRVDRDGRSVFVYRRNGVQNGGDDE